MDALLVFAKGIRANTELMERASHQARESPRNFHRGIVMAGKAMVPLAAALYDFSPCLRLHGSHAALERFSGDPAIAKSALVWPMRSPASHFLGLAAASILALKRHFTHLKLHVRRHMIRLENALALGDVENARDALNLAIPPADEEFLRKLVWSTKSLTEIEIELSVGDASRFRKRSSGLLNAPCAHKNSWENPSWLRGGSRSLRILI